MLHYYPRHVLNINMPIFRRTNCILTASGIVALCKRLHSTQVKSGLYMFRIKNCSSSGSYFCTRSIQYSIMHLWVSNC